MMMLRVASPLPPATEDLIHRVIGCAIDVHRVLGPGLLESAYHNALKIEFECQGISYDCEMRLPVAYRGRIVCNQRLDLLVEGELVVEVKAVDAISRTHIAQILSYMRVCKVRAGLLVNFNAPLLQEGIKRVVL